MLRNPLMNLCCGKASPESDISGMLGLPETKQLNIFKSTMYI